MYCPSCGKKNPENSKFCQHCGEKLDGFTESESSHHSAIDQDTSTGKSNSYPIKKFTIMLAVTYGVYFLYWFERNWQLIKEERKSNISPFWRTVGLFVPILNLFLMYEQFNEIKKLAEEKGIKDTYSPGWRLFWLITINGISLGFLTPIVLNKIQTVFNDYWAIKTPNKSIKTSFSWKEILALLFFIGFYLLMLIGLMSPSDDTSYSSTPVVDTNQATEVTSSNSQYNQEQIASSVVNIYCPSTVSGEEVSGGSGTIITDDGVILTNSHIIPQDKTHINVDEDGCLVILPNPITGQPENIYLATPLVIPTISDDYDLAFMSIHSAYYDEEEQQYRGTYPRKFPAFDDSTRCTNESVKLGEQIRIFGYPAISGGYSLTVTDGVVSSFPGDGLIVTSAKISHGNSGGLAVDQRGCMIGIPSMVSSDDSESLGVIISTDLVHEFSNEVVKYLDK